MIYVIRIKFVTVPPLLSRCPVQGLLAATAAAAMSLAAGVSHSMWLAHTSTVGNKTILQWSLKEGARASDQVSTQIDSALFLTEACIDYWDWYNSASLPLSWGMTNWVWLRLFPTAGNFSQINNSTNHLPFSALVTWHCLWTKLLYCWF